MTTGALELPNERLEAVLAHELAHHRGLHPVMTAVVWWLSLPGVALDAVYRLLHRAVAALGDRLGAIGRVLAAAVHVLLRVWQLTVMWIYWIGELLAAFASRVSEYEADADAARWGYAASLADAYERLGGGKVESHGHRAPAGHPPSHRNADRALARLRRRRAGLGGHGLRIRPWSMTQPGGCAMVLKRCGRPGVYRRRLARPHALSNGFRAEGSPP